MASKTRSALFFASPFAFSPPQYSRAVDVGTRSVAIASSGIEIRVWDSGTGEMSGRILIAAGLALTLGGCASSSGLSTGSLFGGGEAAAAAPAAVGNPAGDPTSRAFQVGSTSARAIKCGYNFDPVKLRTNFLATESASVAVADISRVEKVYDTAYNGVAKAVAGQPDYCSAEKTADIKAHLAKK